MIKKKSTNFPPEVFEEFSTRNIRKISKPKCFKNIRPKIFEKFPTRNIQKISTQEDEKFSKQEWRVLHIPSFSPQL